MAESNDSSSRPKTLQSEQPQQTVLSQAQARSEASSRAPLPIVKVKDTTTSGAGIRHTQVEQPSSIERRDLAAQEIMAETAVWMAVAAFLTLIATSIGTILIWRQVRLTREAVERTNDANEAMLESNRIALAAQRPWITIEAELLSYKRLNDRAIEIAYGVKFTNSGNMLAESIYTRVEFVPMERRSFSDSLEEWFDYFDQDEVVRDAVLVPRGSTYTNGRSSQAIEYLPWDDRENYRKDCMLMVLAMIKYRIPGEERWRVAYRSFSIGENISNVDNRSLVYKNMDSLTVDKLLMQPTGRSRAT